MIGNAASGSLGGLTEDEVEDIFNALRVRKGETTIHWHDFIAAGLSQCEVDDRNLRLAFERLDQEHKGFITFEVSSARYKSPYKQVDSLDETIIFFYAECNGLTWK